MIGYDHINKAEAFFCDGGNTPNNTTTGNYSQT